MLVSIFMLHPLYRQNSSMFLTNGVGALEEAVLEQNITEDLERVPWAELKELASNNLEIIVSVR